MLLLATGGSAAAGICDPGEKAVITKPGNETVIRCRPDYADPTPIVARPQPQQSVAKPRVVEESPARRPKLVHHARHRRARAPNLFDAFASIFRPHHRR